MSSSTQVEKSAARGESGGRIVPESLDILYGHRGTVTAVADEGFRLSYFDGCAGDRTGDSFVTQPITESCTVDAVFVRAPVSLQVVIEPQEAIDEGAAWRIDASGPWLQSSEQIDLEKGEYLIEFRHIEGWQPLSTVSFSADEAGARIEEVRYSRRHDGDGIFYDRFIHYDSQSD